MIIDAEVKEGDEIRVKFLPGAEKLTIEQHLLPAIGEGESDPAEK